MLTNSDIPDGATDDNCEGDKRSRKVAESLATDLDHPDHDADESATILSLLPEIWDQIIPNLRPKDFHSLINALPEWREMLETSKTDKLLPLVLSVLINHNMSRGDILAWRTVNHSSKSIIDLALEKGASPSAYWENFTTHNVSWDHAVEEQPLRRSIENLKQEYSLPLLHPLKWINWVAYINSLGEEPRPQLNPFLTRSVELQIGQPLGGPARHFDPENYMTIINTFLDVFGSRFVTSFTAEITFWGEDTERQGITTFRSSLKRLPLLKVLKVMGQHRIHGGEEEREALRADRFPPLKFLELLDVTEYTNCQEAGDGETRGLNFMLLQTYGHQLKAFICSATFFWMEANFLLFNRETLPNLKFLGVTDLDQHGLGMVARVELPLEELHLSGSVRRLARLGLRTVFRSINNLILVAPSLVHLKLHIRAKVPKILSSRTEDYSEPTVTFPKLKKISARLVYVWANEFWTFVQRQCDNLEEIAMYARRRPIDGGRSEAKLKRGFDLVPSLKQISLYFGYENGENFIPEKIVLFRDERRVYERSVKDVRDDPDELLINE